MVKLNDLKLVKVDELPKRENLSQYREIIKRFIEMKEPYASVSGANSVQGQSLRNAAIKMGYGENVKVTSRGKKMYLINVELSGMKSMHKIGKKLRRKKMEELHSMEEMKR